MAESFLALLEILNGLPRTNRRRLVSISGPPASGKSTLAAKLAAHIENAQLVPMDGFHLDNGILDARTLRSRKGAPETFDVAGFLNLIKRLTFEDEIYFPLFDRTKDCAFAGAGFVPAACDTVIVEGNYLLLDEPVWRDLTPIWDYSVSLHVPQDVLQARLLQRWENHGFSLEGAKKKILNNDLPNARRILQNQLAADLVIENFEAFEAG